MMNYIIIILVILTGILIVGIYLQSPVLYQLRGYNIQQKAPIKSELYFSDKLVLNKTTVLTLYLVSSQDETNVTARIILPEELEVVSGDLTWNGNLVANQTVEVQATVKPLKEGNSTINAVITTQTNEPIVKSLTGETVKESQAITVRYPPAASWIIDKANNYMISLLGEDYFYNNIKFVTSTTQGLNQYAVEYRHPKIDFIQVRLDVYGNVTSYRGPTKPYSFNLTKEQAIEIAKSYGMMEPIEASLVYGGIGFQTDSGNIYESYMWHLYSKSYRSGRPNIVYIGVDNGEILGAKFFPGKVKPILETSNIPFYLNFTKMTDEVVINSTTNVSLEVYSPVNVFNLTIYIDVNPAFEVLSGSGNPSYDDISWSGNFIANQKVWLNATIRSIKQGVWNIEGYVYYTQSDNLPLGNFTTQVIRIVPPEAIPPYQCPSITSIDCMPAVPREGMIYCAGSWAKWIRENCNNITFSS